MQRFREFIFKISAPTEGMSTAAIWYDNTNKEIILHAIRTDCIIGPVKIKNNSVWFFCLMDQTIAISLLNIRLHLTKYQTVLTRAFFNTSLLEPQKPDFSQKKATKVKDHEAPRSQRSKKIWLGKFFLFDFSPNWTILSHLAKVFFRPFLAFWGL